MHCFERKKGENWCRDETSRTEEKRSPSCGLLVSCRSQRNLHIPEEENEAIIEPWDKPIDRANRRCLKLGIFKMVEFRGHHDANAQQVKLAAGLFTPLLLRATSDARQTITEIKLIYGVD